MINKFICGLAVLILGLLTGLNNSLHAESTPTDDNRDKVKSLVPGTLAPSFEMTTIDNRNVSLEDFKGKVTLIIFWATWCGPCKPVIKEVSSLYNQYHLSGFDVIAFSLDKTPEIVREFLAKQQFPWRHNVWLKGETENEIARSYGVRALPTVYLLGRDGKVYHNEFLWAHTAKGTTLGNTPLFAEALKSLLTPAVSNNLQQYGSCLGGTVAVNGAPVEDFSCNLTQIQGQNPGMWGVPIMSNGGNYLFNNVPPGRWLLKISLGGMKGINGEISLLKELGVLENIQWHNFWLSDGSCQIECPINDSYVMFIKKWNEKRKEWLVYSQYRQIVSGDKKSLDRSDYHFNNLPAGTYEYRLCSQIGDNVYIHGGKVEAKPAETTAIAVENLKTNCKIYGKITAFDANLAKPVIFVRNTQEDSIKFSCFYEMGIWDAVAVVRGQGIKLNGQYECSHLPPGNYLVTAGQFRDSYYGIPIVQQSQPVNIDDKKPATSVDFNLVSQGK
jgi:thiol-disulfide isomerase/thioredoxin